MFTVTKRMEVSGAHFLHLDYESKCTNLHGHNWIITVTVQNDTLDKNGMVVDFSKIKEIVNQFDHHLINDVLGDLIQREAGHIFHESGDNYLFMVKSVLDPSIEPGVALSRSRFEDRTFSLGDNLKDGVQTAFGVVRVREHTELELKFNDPATGQLHPGVRETIRNGHNLYVTYPGYSDYRHIPVIGRDRRASALPDL